MNLLRVLFLVAFVAMIAALSGCVSCPPPNAEKQCMDSATGDFVGAAAGAALFFVW